MLRLGFDKETPDASAWKVLVMDQTGRDIIAPILSVQQLRSCGVTLHCQLHSPDKEGVPDVPAVYFIQPSHRNVEALLRDASAGLFDSFHVFFTTSASRELLTSMARQSVELGVSELIASVHEQFSSFFCVEPQLFSLNSPHSFSQALRRSGQLVERVSSALFDLFATLGEIPAIKCRGGTFSEKIAAELQQRLALALRGDAPIFVKKRFGYALRRRKLLLLLDRASDLPAMLHHTATYQSLVHDLLGLRRNRVVLAGDPVDLDSTDSFWAKHKGLPFTDVAEAVHGMVDRQKALQRNFSGSAKDNSALLSAVAELPKLRDAKVLTDRHTAIASALSKKLSQRRLAEFFLAEENLIQRKLLRRKAAEQLLSASEAKLEDKTRLLLIALLSGASGSAEDFGALEALAFAGRESDNKTAKMQKALQTVKRSVGFMKSANPSARKTSDPSVNSSASAVKSEEVKSSMTKNLGFHGQKLWSTLLDKGATLFSEVKGLLPPEKLLHTTREAKAAMHHRVDEDSEFLSFDPQKLSRSGGLGDSEFAYSDAVVFVTGGGSFCEFQNLQDFASGVLSSDSGLNADAGILGTNPPLKTRMGIVYGTTEMISPEGFLEELAEAEFGK